MEVHMKKQTAIVLLALALGTACGCGAARPSKYYQLRAPEESAPPKGQERYSVTLLLAPLGGSRLYRDDRLVYSSATEEMGTYQYQRWAMPPTEMIQETLLRSLRASGRYQAVYSLSSNARGDYLLRGRLDDFKEVSGSSVLARVTLEFELRDMKSGATVWTHFYTHDEPVGAKDVPHVVAALNQNVQRCASEFMAELDQYFASHPAQLSAQQAGQR
jgi:cholesterol transport system auxiliary component